MRIKIKKSRNKQIFFTVQAENGQTLLTSETYKTKQAAVKTITVINAQFSVPLEVHDETITKLSKPVAQTK